MSRRWIIILLLISIAFNLAVLAMFIFITVFNRPPFPPCSPGNMPHFERNGPGPNSFAIPPEIAHKYGFSREKLEPKIEVFIQKRKSFLELLAKPDFSEQEAKAALETSLSAHQELERTLGNHLIELRKKMPSNEAKDFFQRMVDRSKRPRFFHRRMMRDFPQEDPKNE